MTPFMTTVAMVREEARDRLAAVTHVDGTARVQTVSQDSAPELYGILSELERLGGRPLVLNTSQNAAGEPIVGSAEDALAFFVRNPVDAAFIGDLVLERKHG